MNSSYAPGMHYGMTIGALYAGNYFTFLIYYVVMKCQIDLNTLRLVGVLDIYIFKSTFRLAVVAAVVIIKLS